MIFDLENLFSDDQAITATAASTNIVDLGAESDIGKGIPVPLLVQVTEDFDNLTDLTIEVQTDDNESFSSPTTLVSSGAVLLADLTQGFRVPFNYLPTGIERYIRINYTVNGTNPTQGKVTAGVVAALQQGV